MAEIQGQEGTGNGGNSGNIQEPFWVNSGSLYFEMRGSDNSGNGGNSSSNSEGLKAQWQVKA